VDDLALPAGLSTKETRHAQGRELAAAANLDRTVTHRVIRTLEREELLVKQ
jgi:DNA-binding MarR family transcriptional regulator